MSNDRNSSGGDGWYQRAAPAVNILALGSFLIAAVGFSEGYVSLREHGNDYRRLENRIGILEEGSNRRMDTHESKDSHKLDWVHSDLRELRSEDRNVRIEIEKIKGKVSDCD